VDGWVRNTVANLQVQESDVERIKALPVEYKTDLDPGYTQLEDGADRVLGAWVHSLNMPARNSAIGCCGGNVSRALHYLWANIIQSEDKDLEINLLLNRASPWADIHSYLPYEGKVVVKLKKSQDNILIRIPEWTDWNQVSCDVNGSSREHIWSDNYINIEKGSRGIK